MKLINNIRNYIAYSGAVLAIACAPYDSASKDAEPSAGVEDIVEIAVEETAAEELYSVFFDHENISLCIQDTDEQLEHILYEFGKVIERRHRNQFSELEQRFAWRTPDTGASTSGCGGIPGRNDNIPVVAVGGYDLDRDNQIDEEHDVVGFNLMEEDRYIRIYFVPGKNPVGLYWERGSEETEFTVGRDAYDAVQRFEETIIREVYKYFYDGQEGCGIPQIPNQECLEELRDRFDDVVRKLM